MPRITSKGQVTIPQHVRERLGLMPGCDCRIDIDPTHEFAQIFKVRTRLNRGLGFVESLRGVGTLGETTRSILERTRGKR